MSEPYLIMKRGLYYRPNNQGYTGIRDLAGRYPKAEAEAEALRSDAQCNPITAVPLSQAPEFSPACFDDLARDHLRQQRDDLRRVLISITEGAIQNEGVRLASPDYADHETVEIPLLIGELREAVRLTNYECQNPDRIRYAGPAREAAE